MVNSLIYAGLFITNTKMSVLQLETFSFPFEK